MGLVNNVIVTSFSFQWEISHVIHTTFFHVLSLLGTSWSRRNMESILYSLSRKFSMGSCWSWQFFFWDKDQGQNVNNFLLSLCSHSENFMKKALFYYRKKKMPMPIFAQKTIQMPTRKFTLVKQQLKKYRNRISSTLNIIYCSYSCTIHCHGKCYCTFERFNKIQNPSLGFLISINKTIEMLLIYYRILNEIFFWLKRMKVTY